MTAGILGENQELHFKYCEASVHCIYGIAIRGEVQKSIQKLIAINSAYIFKCIHTLRFLLFTKTTFSLISFRKRKLTNEGSFLVKIDIALCFAEKL